MCGVPYAECFHSMAANLSSALPASARQTGCWPSASRLTLNVTERRIFGQLVDVRAMLKVTSAGSSESAWNVPTIKPLGLPVAWSAAQIAATPVGKRRMTARY